VLRQPDEPLVHTHDEPAKGHDQEQVSQARLGGSFIHRIDRHLNRTKQSSSAFGESLCHLLVPVCDSPCAAYTRQNLGGRPATQRRNGAQIRFDDAHGDGKERRWCGQSGTAIGKVDRPFRSLRTSTQPRRDRIEKLSKGRIFMSSR